MPKLADIISHGESDESGEDLDHQTYCGLRTRPFSDLLVCIRGAFSMIAYAVRETGRSETLALIRALIYSTCNEILNRE
jgi:hypothetical protein